MTTADRRFSMMIRERDGFTCMGCGKGFEPNDGRLNCAHCFGRAKPRTRTDPDNALSLCWECHGWFDEHPLRKYDLFRTWLGDQRFEMLQRRSNGV